MCDTHVEKRRGRVQEAIRLGLGSFDPESAPASRAERIMRKIAACRTPRNGIARRALRRLRLHRRDPLVVP